MKKLQEMTPDEKHVFGQVKALRIREGLVKAGHRITDLLEIHNNTPGIALVRKSFGTKTVALDITTRELERVETEKRMAERAERPAEVVESEIDKFASVIKKGKPVSKKMKKAPKKPMEAIKADAKKKEARFIQHHVLAGRGKKMTEYRSLKQAFEELGISLKQHQKFRLQLKKEHTAIHETGFKFQIVEKHKEQ